MTHMNHPSNFDRPASTPQPWPDRRGFLSDAATALGSIALLNLLGDDRLLADQPTIDPARPFAARSPHFPAKAKNVLVIFCAGAVSQLETWDYKPELIKHDGKPLPGGPAVTFQGPAGDLARPQYAFRQRGQTGKWVSDLIPHLAELTDEFAFVHSLTSKSNTHGPAENFLSTGTPLDGFPSLGSWVSYALGSENQNLPSYVAIPDPRGVPQNGSNNWGSGFLPAAFQGTPLSSKEPIRNLVAPGVSDESDRAARLLLQRMNQRHQDDHPGESKLAARIASYELAGRMQLSMPEISDLSSEPAHVMKAYGADDESHPVRAAYARNCILARRLVERGVRFVQLFNGAYASGGELNWDGHNKLKEQYDKHAMVLDQPTAAMIQDIKSRRTARRHADRMVYRIWAHALLSKRLGGSRSQSRRIHVLDDRRGHQAGCQPRNDGRVRTESGPGRSAALRFQCDHLAPARVRS